MGSGVEGPHRIHERRGKHRDKGLDSNGGQGRRIGHSQRDCIAYSTNVLVVHLCPHCSFIFNWLALLHAILAPHSRLFTRNAVPVGLGASWGAGQVRIGRRNRIRRTATFVDSVRRTGNYSDCFLRLRPNVRASGARYWGQRLTIRRVRREGRRRPYLGGDPRSGRQPVRGEPGADGPERCGLGADNRSGAGAGRNPAIGRRLPGGPRDRDGGGRSDRDQRDGGGLRPRARLRTGHC